MKRKKVLLADDDGFLLSAFEMTLGIEYDVFATTSVSDAKALVLHHDLDVAVVDLNFEGQADDGLSLVDFILKNRPQTSIVVMSGDNSTARVTNAMRRPIVDFIVKGDDSSERLEMAVQRGVQLKEDRSVAQNLFQTRSPHMQKMLTLLQRIVSSSSQSPILITGEPGTGKEHTAKHIGAAAKKKVVTTNMANHRAELADSALFGHLKGAFTGADQTRAGLIEQAHNGIFFLDEIGETPLDVQAKLLRVVQEKEFNAVGSTTVRKVDLRFIAATNRDLGKMAEQGAFRKDLLERLSTWTLRIPPLRERPEDVVYLTNLFLSEFTKTAQPFKVEPDAIAVMLDYHWPGNVRELRNVIERVVTLWDNRVLDRESVVYGINQGSGVSFESDVSAPEVDLTRESYQAALKATQGNRSQAAKLLRVGRATFYRRLREWNLELAPRMPVRKNEAEVI